MASNNISMILDLSLPDRLEIVQDLWDSIAREADAVPIPDFHLEEIRRRLEDHRRAPTAGSPWEEVERRIRARK